MRTPFTPFFFLLGVAVCAQSPALDPDFDAGSSCNEYLHAVAVQEDGRILVGGTFTSFQGSPHLGIVRLMPDGSLDPSFGPVPLPNSHLINALAIDDTGRILIGGYFNFFDGTAISGIARLNPDGSRDPSFDPGAGPNYSVDELIVQPDGKILIGGNFTSVNGVSRRGIARLITGGSLDPDFNIGNGFSSLTDPAYPYVRSLALDQQGRILVGGWFDSFNGVETGKLVRLSPQGLLDTNFSPVIETWDAEVQEILVLADQRIRIAGDFIAVNGQVQEGIAGLLPNGAVDPLFLNGYPNSNVHQLVEDLGGILVGGQFTAYQGAVRNNLARVNLNGVLDPGFNVGFGFDGNAVYISALARQPDGKILVIGDFESFNGTERIDVLRLMPSASYVDCLGTLSGPALPGSPCDDLDEGTVNDTWTADCECLGIPLVPDCVGDLGGTALPGTPCDDEDNTTTDDTWTNDCECEGTPPVVDCMGVLGGPNTPGAPCDDGILFTTNDTWTFACECEGFDCAGQQGGLGLPGTPCDDGVSWTYQDTWSADCECMGVGMVGIADQIEGKTHFQLWPNPTQPGEGFWIQTSYVGSVQLEVIDPLGRTQRTITYYAVSNKPIHLSTQGLQAGSYLLHIQNGVEREVHRIVIR